MWYNTHSMSAIREVLFMKGSSDMENGENELSMEEETCKPLTDEEFKEYQEKDARTTKRVLGIFSAIWDAISLFFS